MVSPRPTRSSSSTLRAPLWGIVLLVVVVSGLLVDTTRADNDNFYSDILRLDNVAAKIHQGYVEDIESKKLIDKAVEGMLTVLDPHTSYFESKQFEDLRIHTEGKFGGLGIQISLRDNVLTVMTPISGTPASRAGIQSGDQILQINGASTKGIKIDDAVGKLRGDPGTKVTIIIRRRGEAEFLTYTLTREVIKINAVPFVGMLDSSIGYVTLSTFSQNAGAEIEKAVKELLRKKMKGLILDLRGNPGGLLPEAIEVAANFLPMGSLVVSTRGRAPGQNQEHKVKGVPVLPGDIPMVVLVNYASASASEIVAGALQDWDRGVVAGDTSFGKGSVQTIVALDPEHHLKLTTAFYYTPSGRCINRPENAVRGRDKPEDEFGDSAGTETDSLVKPDSTHAKARRDTTTYRTKGMRRVYGGGGIVPDTVISLRDFQRPIRALFMKDVFFQFANYEHPRLQKRKAVVDANSAISDAIMQEFRSFLDSLKFEYKSPSGLAFDEFLAQAGLKDTSSDSTPSLSSDRAQWTSLERAEMLKSAERVKTLLKSEQERNLKKVDSEIRKYIKEALLVREFGSDHEIVYRYRLADDNQVQVAQKLLADKSSYKKLLAP